VYDPWNYLPCFVLLLASFAIPYLHHAVRGPKGPSKETYPLGLQGSFFFIASWLLWGLSSELFVNLAVLYGLNPMSILVFARFLSPTFTLLIVTINWYQLVIARGLSALIVTLLAIGSATFGLGALSAVFTPLILVGQPPGNYLYFYSYPILGATLISAGIFAWVKKEHFLQLLSA
jgi:hypothetical protein